MSVSDSSVCLWALSPPLDPSTGQPTRDDQDMSDERQSEPFQCIKKVIIQAYLLSNQLSFSQVVCILAPCDSGICSSNSTKPSPLVILLISVRGFFIGDVSILHANVMLQHVSRAITTACLSIVARRWATFTFSTCRFIISRNNHINPNDALLKSVHGHTRLPLRLCLIVCIGAALVWCQCTIRCDPRAAT